MELRETETETAKLTWMREDCENVKWAGDGGKRGETRAGMWRQRMRERERENNPSVSLARQLNACHIMRWSLAALSLETHTHETHTYTTQTWHTHTWQAYSDNHNDKDDSEEGMKWQRSRCLVVSRLSGDLFTFKFSELDDVTSEGAGRGERQGGDTPASGWLLYSSGCDATEATVDGKGFASSRLVSLLLHHHFLWPYEILEKFTKR